MVFRSVLFVGILNLERPSETKHVSVSTKYPVSNARQKTIERQKSEGKPSSIVKACKELLCDFNNKSDIPNIKIKETV